MSWQGRDKEEHMEQQSTTLGITLLLGESLENERFDSSRTAKANNQPSKSLISFLVNGSAVAFSSTLSDEVESAGRSNTKPQLSWPLLSVIIFSKCQAEGHLGW